jgi:UDPglucose 6-dehydrogenase/UDP-N-acetyl-D-galactosamine dehydrogenase
MKKAVNKEIVCIIGLGYVGLPLAEAFARSLPVIGFDTDIKKIDNFKEEYAGSDLISSRTNLSFTSNPAEIKKARYIIICVPTPVTPSKEPDMKFIISASQTIGNHLSKNSIVVLESTVFPGCTEEIVKPILEEQSGYKCGRDFKIAYSPERINPGDTTHTLAKTTKVVSGMDKETTRLVADLYHNVAGTIFITPNIRTAEAAKVIENIQRDLNIALMNELSLIFERMGLNTSDVLDAAATKWNFHRYSPGLVGGHCIPVDPYYLVYKAIEYDYHSQVILSGRSINDSMPKHVAEMTIKALNNIGKVIKGSKVLIMGLTYKENVSDTRESPVTAMIKELREFGIEVYGFDPLLDDIKSEFTIKVAKSLGKVQKYDAVILTVSHDKFRSITLPELKAAMTDHPVLIDIRQIFKRSQAKKEGFYYQTL